MKDSGVGICEDLAKQVWQWLNAKTYAHCSAWVYKPGEDSSGLEDEDRELLGIEENKSGWRVKIHIPMHAHVESKPLPVPGEYTPGEIVLVPMILEVFDLAFDDNLNITQETLDGIKASITEHGVKLVI